MATTLLEPKIKILAWNIGQQDVLEYERWVEKTVDEAKGKCVSETIKITWLAPSNERLLCIIEWCEWADANHKD